VAKHPDYIVDDVARASEITVPIMYDSKVLGVIDSESSQPDFFNGHHLFFLTQISQLIASKIADTQNSEKLQDTIARLEHSRSVQSALFSITGLADSSGDLEDFCRSTHDIIAGLVYAESFYVAIYDETTDTLTFPYFVSTHEASPIVGRTSDFEEIRDSLTGHVLRTGKALRGSPEQLKAQFPSLEILGIKPLDYLGVPLQSSDHIVGMLAVQSHKKTQVYLQEDEELLIFVAQHITKAYERQLHIRQLETSTEALQRVNESLREHIEYRKKIEDKLLFDSTHDTLTRLPNRALFMERLEHALNTWKRNSNITFAVLFMDLDRFKIINDSLGHAAGDELLIQVGQRISHCLRPSDTVARLGGDEFAVLLYDLAEDGGINAVIERLFENFDKAFPVEEKEIFTSTSIGSTFVHPRYHSADKILQDADAAMYQAKSQGRRRHVAFDESMYSAAAELLYKENDMRRGFTNGEFVPYFQPILRLKDQTVIGFEALVRWLHPEKGLFSPSHFMDVAEDSGLILDIDWAIFIATLSHIRHWTDELNGIQDLRFSVNFSSRHFQTSNLASRIKDALIQFDLPGDCLRVEVMEGAAIQHQASAKALIDEMQEFGIE
ncbi:MAG: diguanylate cyclase, partial [Pseudomonadota bacterium]